MVLEQSLESPLDCKEIQPVHPKGDQSWVFIGRTDAEAETPILWTSATWGEELAHWKRPWCWEKLKAGGEGDDGGWDGWMASPTQWTWVWVNSGSWWWTGRPDVLQSMGSQRVRHDWVTELNWTITKAYDTDRKTQEDRVNAQRTGSRSRSAQERSPLAKSQSCWMHRRFWSLWKTTDPLESISA